MKRARSIGTPGDRGGSNSTVSDSTARPWPTLGLHPIRWWCAQRGPTRRPDAARRLDAAVVSGQPHLRRDEGHRLAEQFRPDVEGVRARYREVLDIHARGLGSATTFCASATNCVSSAPTPTTPGSVYGPWAATTSTGSPSARPPGRRRSTCRSSPARSRSRARPRRTGRRNWRRRREPRPPAAVSRCPPALNPPTAQCRWSVSTTRFVLSQSGTSTLGS